MPQQEGHKRRSLEEDDPFQWHAPGPYVELGLASNFSFLRAASDAVDLVSTANLLGYHAMGVADFNTLAGVVRVHTEAKKACVMPLIGARLVLMCGTVLLAYPRDARAYARLSVLLSKGKMADVDGGWQEKGETHLTLEMVAAHSRGLQLIVMPSEELAVFEVGLPRLIAALPQMRHVGAAYLYRGDDVARIARLDRIATRNAAEVTSLTMAKNTLLEADPFEAATKLEEAQFQLQSLYTVTVRSSELSLVNFL